jgi:hypothetical protein
MGVAEKSVKKGKFSQGRRRQNHAAVGEIGAKEHKERSAAKPQPKGNFWQKNKRQNNA